MAKKKKKEKIGTEIKTAICPLPDDLGTCGTIIKFSEITVYLRVNNAVNIYKEQLKSI